MNRSSGKIKPKAKARSRQIVAARRGWWGSVSQFFGQFRVSEWLLLSLVIGLASKPLQDPDFGWHLRAGNDFLRTWHWPYVDPYTYTMSDWPWVNHEWLSQVFTAIVHNLFGNLGLSIVFGLLLAVVFTIAAAAASPTSMPFRLVASLIALLASLPILGVRMQMFTLLGLVVILWAFYRYRSGTLKQLWWIIPMFVLWTNLHGGFPIGLATLAMLGLVEIAKRFVLDRKWKFGRWIQEATLTWPQIRHLAITGSLAAVATLINPYGWRLHQEIYNALTNTYMLQNISEWQAVSLNNPISYNYLIYLIFFGILFLLAYRKFEPTRLIVSAVFLYLSLLHWRNMPFFMLMSIGFLAEIMEQNAQSVFRALTQSKVFLIALTLAAGIMLGRQTNDLIKYSFNDNLTLRLGNYPIDAINWAKQNPDQIGTRMFNDYGWGGMLLWKFPEQKVFIDGRMPHWRLPALPGQPGGERWIFKDHNDLTQAETNSLDILDKYQVDWALVGKASPIYWVLLGQEDWQAKYQDGIAAIFAKADK